MTPEEIEKLIDSYPAKYRHGFTDAEVKDITSKIPNINMEKVYDALFANTCEVIDDTLINYCHDVRIAITCGIQNRNLKVGEWD